MTPSLSQVIFAWILRQNYQLMRELRGGELVQVRSGFLAVGAKYFRFLHQMYDEESGAMAATCDCVAVQAALETNQRLPLDDALRERAKTHLVTDNVTERSLPGGLSGPPRDGAQPVGGVR